MESLTEVIKEILGQMKHIAATNTVVGDPVQMEDSVIIPITKLSLGFGVGAANSKEATEKSVGGSGGGITIEPVGFIVSNKEEAKLLLVDQKSGSFGKVLELIPPMIEKIAGKIQTPKDKVNREDKGKGKGNKKKK